MNGQSDHPHVPDGLFTPHRPALPASPINIDDQVDPKDKFAWLESIFQVNLDPQIDAYLYGTNTAQDWEDFLNYLTNISVTWMIH